MELQQFNALEKARASELLATCCGSSTWLKGVMEAFPFSSETNLIQTLDRVWYEECGQEDWLEAFNHHPKIGDRANLGERFASTAHLATEEQAGVAETSGEVLDELAALNSAYASKHGFIFIVSAMGKSADEMLQLLRSRIQNSREEEIMIAMGEQQKITISRIKKIIPSGNWSQAKPGQLTTHVLDTSIGKPGAGIMVKLKRKTSNGLTAFALGLTNADGRIPDLLPTGRLLPPGMYTLCFESEAYFKKKNLAAFYPEVAISFNIFDDTHYHVPLLLNPFGYSTYRGS